MGGGPQKENGTYTKEGHSPDNTLVLGCGELVVDGAEVVAGGRGRMGRGLELAAVGGTFGRHFCCCSFFRLIGRDRGHLFGVEGGFGVGSGEGMVSERFWDGMG